jgi:hypothetical protein
MSKKNAAQIHFSIANSVKSSINKDSWLAAREEAVA